MLDSIELASDRVVPGTLEGETLEMLLLLGAMDIPIAELLLSDVGIATTDELALKLGEILDDATLTGEEITSCEETRIALAVERGRTLDVLILEVLETTID